MQKQKSGEMAQVGKNHIASQNGFAPIKTYERAKG